MYTELDISDCACFVENDGKVAAVNAEFFDLTGFSEKEVAGMDTGAVLGEMLRAAADLHAAEREFDCYIFTKSLEAREVTVVIHQAGGEGGKKYHIIEKPDSRLENKLASIYRLLNDNKLGVAIYSSPDLILLEANQCYLDLFDEPYKDRNRSIGRGIDVLIQSAKESRDGEILRNVVKTGSPFYARAMEGGSGSLKDVFSNCVIMPYFENGSVKYVFAIIENVTSRMLAEKISREQAALIKQQKEQFERIIDNISDSLVILDRDGKYIKINNSFKQSLKAMGIDHEKYDLDELGEKMKTYLKYYNEFGDELSYEDLPCSRVLKGETIEQERVIIDVDKNRLYLEMSAIPIFDESGSVQLGIITSRDRTYLVEYVKLLEKQQQIVLEAEKEKNRELEKLIKVKDEFFTLITHEFKTPLTVIDAAIQAMEFICKDQLTDKAKSYLGRIRQNANRQLRLVNNLLDITKVNAGQFRLHTKDLDIVFLTKAIVDSVQLFARQKDIALTFTSKLSKKIIAIDDEKFERVLLNLLSNAIKFTPRGKSVTVSVSRKICANSRKVCICVKDQGVGIPEDKREQIFEKFGQVDSSLTRQAEGTGLGLSLVKLLVNTLNGEITLDSKPGKGSTFSILLPETRCESRGAEKVSDPIPENRLVQAAAIEFSDIYF